MVENHKKIETFANNYVISNTSLPPIEKLKNVSSQVTNNSTSDFSQTYKYWNPATNVSHEKTVDELIGKLS